MRPAGRLPGAPRRLLLVLIVLGAGASGFAPEASAQPHSITILHPIVVPELPENRALIDRVILQAAARANDLYGQYIDVDYDQGSRRADYSVLPTASFSGADGTFTARITRNRDETEGESATAIGEIGAESAIHLANMLFYLWGSLNGYLAEQMTRAPEYVEEIPLDLTSRSLFGTGGMLAPWSVAVRADSRILVGTSTVCLEMDRSFRVLDQPGRELYEAGEQGYGSLVAVTPAGTAFFKNPGGGKVVKWFGSGLKPQSWRIGTEFMGSFTALADGSALVTHAGMQQTLRLEGRRPERVEFLSRPNLYCSAVAGGPEGNIWVYSVVERKVRIYTPEGRLVDSIIPLDPDRAVPTQMSVYPDGSFLFFARGSLYRFRRSGIPVWRTDDLLGPEEFASLSGAWAAADPNTGLIYLADMQGRRIIKLLDLAYAEALGIRNENEEQLIRWNRQLLRDPDDLDALRYKAELYERIGAMEMARSMWEKILEIDPSRAEVEGKLDEIELARLLLRAAEMEEQTRTVLENLGPESARAPYAQAMQMFEQILALDPGNSRIQAKRRDLKLLFDQSQRRIVISEASIEDLFPALIEHYRTQPVGTVRVLNVLDEEVRELTASLFIEGYMDFPTRSAPLPRLQAGGTASLDLMVLFNTAVFALQEDLPVQASIQVDYQSGGRPEKTSTVEALTLHRKTALVWDDSAKLAAFIMPNEETVSTFAHRVSDVGEAEGRWRLSSRLLRGIRVCDALGSCGISYIEDPDSPISRVLGKSAVVDTVRFPRTTLLIRSGDCDDTTALLGSLLESVGIPTAIMTSPGHVFLAFDTGEAEENLWLFSHRNLQALVHRGTVWLPVETTALEAGFLPAWERASEVVRRHRGKIEFLPVREQRDRYPPLPVPATELSVLEPLEQEIDSLFASSIEAVEDTLYRESLKVLESAMQNGRAGEAVRLGNRIGVLHARFGADGEAEAEFNRCLAWDPGFIPAYLNLANLKLLRGEPEAAAGVARSGLERSPDSALLNLFMALYHSRKGDAAGAAAYLDRVRGSSPELARRYAYLADEAAGPAGAATPGGSGRGSARGAAGGAARGSDWNAAGGDLPLIWDPGE